MTEGLIVREIYGSDINQDFLDVLASLSDPGLTVERAKTLFIPRINKGIWTFGAFLDGRMVGTASLFVEQKFLHGGGRVAHVEDVAVHKDHRWKGVGKALLEYLEKKARQAGCYKMILDCDPRISDFYQKSGYHEYETQMRKDLA